MYAQCLVTCSVGLVGSVCALTGGLLIAQLLRQVRMCVCVCVYGRGGGGLADFLCGPSNKFCTLCVSVCLGSCIALWTCMFVM